MYVLNPTPEEMKAASAIAEVACLAQVRLNKSEATLLVDPRSLGGKLPVEVQFDLVRFDALEEGRLLVEVRLDLDVHRQGKSKGSKVLTQVARVGLSLVAEYGIPKGPIPADIEREALPAFARYNGIFNCWPYFRAELQHVTAMMALPSFSLAPLVVRAEARTASVENQGVNDPIGRLGKGCRPEKKTPRGKQDARVRSDRQPE